ncbi:hypothetical protein, partial [Pseudomonas aeruginosa]|uniref:hypothetical protein n=1 Tax=Pseudomonas aeruginosa TaxID=287 RepID=UPI003CC64B1B
TSKPGPWGEWGVCLLVSRAGRGNMAAQVNAPLLAIADSRFQQAQAEQAQTAGKLPKDFVLPEPYRHNTPHRLQALD